MATRKFLTSVADVYAYDNSENLVFTGKTLLDSSVEVSLGSAPVRGGKGNQLQYIYYHTGEMKFTLTDTQWNLAMIASTVGADYETSSFYEEETVTVTASSGSVAYTPLAFSGTTVYGWATSPLGVTQRVTFNGAKGFSVTGAETSGAWCVRYYTANTTSGQAITIKANMIPKVVKLVMETQLNSADVTTNKIGIVQIIAPTVTLSGAFTISMKADGVSNTPLTGTALAYTPASGTDACATEPYYAKIVEIIDSSYWYSNVVGLSIQGGDTTVSTSGCTTLAVWAIPSTGAAYKLANSVLTFGLNANPTAGNATIGANTGIFWSGSTTGCAIINVYISASSASTIDTTATYVVA
jgi:hypothetical protein